MRRVGLVLAATLLPAVGACGGSSQDAFCADYPDLSANLGQLGDPSSDAFQRLTDDLDDLDPPAEIADAHDTLIASLDEIAEAGTITDPGAAPRIADVQTSVNEIQTYLTEHC